MIKVAIVGGLLLAAAAYGVFFEDPAPQRLPAYNQYSIGKCLKVSFQVQENRSGSGATDPYRIYGAVTNYQPDNWQVARWRVCENVEPSSVVPASGSVTVNGQSYPFVWNERLQGLEVSIPLSAVPESLSYVVSDADGKQLMGGGWGN